MANILTYGDSLTFDRNDVEEARLRSPMHFTSSIHVPTFAIEGAKPLSMNAYKVALTRTVVKRALLAAVGNRYWEG